LADVEGGVEAWHLLMTPSPTDVANVYNGTVFYDVDNYIISQDGTYLKLGEAFSHLTIQGQQWGQLYCLSGNSSSGSTWVLADASALSTSTGMLGVGIIDNGTGSGLLLRGFINVISNAISGTDVPGAPLYMSIVSGRYSFDPPTSTGEIVRIVGHFVQAFQDQNLDVLYTIYFNPDNTWIEL
jgi:hypothetical protein